MIGRALNGRYELVGALGVGGMATVWQGVDRVLGRPVAVKVLNGGLAEDPRFAERFGREAQHAAMLVHPRIAMVFDSGMDQGSPYIVMELIRGQSLSALLAQRGPLPLERAVGIAAAVCEALEVAHAAGLVHRDIKPGNIMITDDGGVKVVDFGIARANAAGGQQLTQTATVLGTAAYLSPEQATAAEVDGRADLYALGCVLTEMLTGQPPFTADTPVAIAFMHVTEEPAPIALRRPEVPPALDAAVLRLLAKRPADRPAGAGAARAELLAAIPVAGATDRTSELLTTMLPAAPSPGYRPGAAHTSVMASFPDFPEDLHEAPAARRPRRALAWVLGAAALAGASLLAVLAFSNGSSAPPPARTAQPAQQSAPADPATKASPASSPAATGKQTPDQVVSALRDEVAQAALPKDRQTALLKTLDAASTAITDGKQQDAVQQLKSAQRQVRDLAKKHAVDGPAAATWQRQLTTAISTLTAGAADNGDNGN